MPKALPTWDSSSIDDVLRFARVRLVALDVDGTLLQRSVDDLAEIVASINRQLRFGTRGVDVTVATGRALSGTRRIAEALDSRRSVPAILYNGAVIAVVEKKRTLQHFRIPRNDVLNVMVRAASLGAVGLAYSIGRPILTSQPEPIIERVYALGAARAHLSEEFNGLPVQWLSDVRQYPEVETVAILVQAEEPMIRELILAELKAVATITTTSSGASFIEVRPREANKGVALAWVASTLGVRQDEVLALGDNDNDAEMLKWAGIGVAVGNSSSQTALQNADYVCRHGSMSAAVEVLRLVKHAKRFARSSLLRIHGQM